jgi:hypothetical protein
MQNKLTKFICLLLALLLVFGCIATPQKMVEANGIVKDYLLEHPKSTIEVNIYTPEMIKKDFNFWNDNCKTPPRTDVNYYLAKISDSNYTLKALFEKSQMIFICGVIQDTSTMQVIIQQENPQLQQKTCSSVGGLICDLNQKCSGNWVKVTDSNRCCNNLCKIGLTTTTQTDTDTNTPSTPTEPDLPPCSGITPLTCKTTEKCTMIKTDQNVNCGCSKCEVKLCKDYGGLVCPTDTNCYGDISTAPDTSACCIGVCYKVEETITDSNTP